MARRRGNFRYAVLALAIAAVLWGIAHSSTSVERSFDIPIEYEELPQDLVITGQSADELNVRLQGSRAALRNFSPRSTQYSINVSGAKVGETIHEVETSQLDLPRGVRVVSRSPAQIEVRFEGRGRKNVRVRPDLSGEPPPGYQVGEVTVDPPRVWLTGARSRVLRLAEVVTETIDVSGLQAATEREARLSLGSDYVWMEQEGPVTVRIAIVPPPVSAPQASGPGPAQEAP